MDDRQVAAVVDAGLKLPVWAVCGHGRAGKDTAGEFLTANTPMRFRGATSKYLHPHVVARTGMDPAECWERRHEMRQLWYDLGNELRAEDPTVLLRASLADGNTILAGCRDACEIEAGLASGLIDLAIWIENERVPEDPTMTYGPELCDVVLQNNWDIPAFHNRLRRFVAQTRVPLVTGGAGPALIEEVIRA